MWRRQSTLGKLSSSKTPIAVIIMRVTYPLRERISVRSFESPVRALLINALDTMSEEARQETVRILRSFSEQIPKATVPRRLALEYSEGSYSGLCRGLT